METEDNSLGFLLGRRWEAVRWTMGTGLALRGRTSQSAAAMIVAITGLLAGMFHVISGPDHLAAVAPLAVRAHRKSWIPGVRWGVGHSAGVAAVGLLAVALRGVLPLERLSAVSERLVGVLLLFVGVWSLRIALRVQVHTHVHEHDGEQHSHVHVHDSGHRHAESAAPHSHGHAAFFIGTLHGLAGSSHFLGVLPALALPTAADAALYLIAFAVGTVLAMAGFAGLLGWIAQRGSMNGTTVYRGLMGACALVAFGVGGWWIFGAPL